MMAAILNSAILDSDTAILDSNTLLSSLRFTLTLSQKFHSYCTLTLTQFTTLFNLTQTHSFWLNLMMAAILNSAILDSDTAILDKTPCYLLTQLLTQSIHSDSNWLDSTALSWIQMACYPSWILPSWIQPCCTKLWLKLIQSDSNSFILTQLDDGSHLEFGHLGFSDLSFSSQTHSHLPRLVPTIFTKKIHSFILTELDDGSHLELCHLVFSHLHKKTSLMHSHSNWWFSLNSDDGSHLEFGIWLTWWWQPS